MTFVSYSQNYEDVMLWRSLRSIEHGFYIDVGAAWPDVDSVTKAFYQHGWRGINIEPNEELFLSLKEKRLEDINLNYAISDVNGVLHMNFLSNKGLSTADEEIASGHIERGNLNIRREVEAKTLDQVWVDHVPEGQEVHFVKIDVEGLEKSVISGLDWHSRRPWIVVVEATLPMSQVESHEEWEPILLSAGYLMAYADGLNRFYVAREREELMDRFRYPPNIWDDYVLSRQVELENINHELRDNLHKTQLEFHQLHSEYNAILQSRSWRMTKPFRLVMLGLKRLFNF